MSNKYMKDLAIDPYSLDTELMDQPGLLAHYGQELASAKKQQEKLEEKLAVALAQLDAKIREKPHLFGLSEDKKITEKFIEAKQTLDAGIQSLKAEVIEAQFEVNVLTWITKAFTQRKTSLELMVELYKSEYWAGPKEPRMAEPGKRMIDVQDGEKAAAQKLRRRREE